MSASFREAMRFTSGEVISRRDDNTTERKPSELATDWPVDGTGTRVFAGIRGEGVHVAEVLLPDGSTRELPTVGHINFAGDDGLEQNILTAEGEVWRVEPGEVVAQQLPDELIEELIERATEK